MPGPGSYWIGAEELQEVMEVFQSGYLSRYGDLEDPDFKHKVYTLEKEFAKYCGVSYALATSSGTGSLMISMLAMGLEPGDEVIVPILLWRLTVRQFLPAWCRSWLKLMRA